MTSPSTDDFAAVLQSCLARRTPEAQVDLLSTSLATENRRRRIAELDNALLRADLEKTSTALEDTRVALLRAEHDRELLCATIVAQLDATEQPRSHSAPDNELVTDSPDRRLFADRTQAIVAIGGLLRRFKLDDYWSAKGLTLDPNHLRRDDDPLPLAARVLLLAAHDLLSEQPTLAFVDAVEHLRGEALEAICALVRPTDDVEEPLLLTVRG